MVNFNYPRTFFFFLLQILLISYSSITLSLDEWEVSAENSKAGMFDFYVYAVTWQPSFCTMHNISNCSNEFKVHGIWPYYITPTNATIKNYHPSYCLSSAGCKSFTTCDIDNKTLAMVSNNNALKSLLPDNYGALIRHEWKKHGSCSGLTQADYFHSVLTLDQRDYYQPAMTMIKKNAGHPIQREALMATLPKSTSLWCKVHDGKYLLYEIHFFINKEGKPFYNTDTQIGTPCPSSFIAPVFQ